MQEQDGDKDLPSLVRNYCQFIMKGYHIDWSVIPVYINLVHLWPHNIRAKRSRVYYYQPQMHESTPFSFINCLRAVESMLQASQQNLFHSASLKHRMIAEKTEGIDDPKAWSYFPIPPTLSRGKVHSMIYWDIYVKYTLLPKANVLIFSLNLV